MKSYCNNKIEKALIFFVIFSIGGAKGSNLFAQEYKHLTLEDIFLEQKYNIKSPGILSWTEKGKKYFSPSVASDKISTSRS